MYYSYIEIEYVDKSFSPSRTDLALKLLNKVSKSRLDLHSHWGSLPNEREGMSVIEFSSPAM
jgi:hypothetical protein